ncbi:MAG: alpha/beta hydrolase [Actinomycetia bacterium]|nr:alpha/beta hydrolase [Actinomycetes bacterium]
MRLAFDTAGPDSGPPIVLLHGLTGSRERYSRLVDWLSSRGHRVVNVDLGGHGESAWADAYRASDYAIDVVELIETEQIGPAVIVGHSMGGTVAVTLATRRPEMVEALFLEDPALYATEEDISGAEEFMTQVRDWQSSGATEDEVVGVIGHWPSAHPDKTFSDLADADELAAYARALLAFDLAALEAFVRGDTFMGHEPGARAECPVTVIRADPALGAAFLPEHGDRYLAAVPQAQIVAVEGSGHSILGDPVGHGPYMKALDDLLSSL